MSKHIEEPRPHPLRSEATWKAIIIGGGAIGTVFGVELIPSLTEQMTQAVQLVTIGGGLYAAPQAAARAGEKYVTPIEDPRDNDGNKLIPEATARPTDYSI